MCANFVFCVFSVIVYSVLLYNRTHTNKQLIGLQIKSGVYFHVLFNALLL